jgi:flavin reductase (DIM6/NTAB) family NADH-FMN oxidoreductase RutF
LVGELRRIDLAEAERLLYPVIPAFVTSEFNGRVGGMLAAWWTQLSFKPFLVGVAIAPERFTYKLVRSSKIFALNLLDFKYVDRTPLLGDVSERFYPGKLKAAGFTIVKGDVLGAPIVLEATAALELTLMDIIKTGDHDLFIGEVKAAYAREEFKGLWDLRLYKPLMYLGRTRRPDMVRRVYVAFKDVDVRELEYAPGPLKEYSNLRFKVLEEVEEAVKRLSNVSLEEKLQAIARILESHGLDPGDAEYYLEEVGRRLV